MPTTRDIARKAATDAGFRTELINDPKGAIAKEFGTRLPENVSVRVHENTATELHLVVDPPAELAASRAMSTQELQQVSGGLKSVKAITGTNTWCRLV